MDMPIRHLDHEPIKMGEYRWWNSGGVRGMMDAIKVKIVGLATTGAPVIGRTYIVELPAWVNFGAKHGYDYTHIAAFECHLYEEHPSGAAENLVHYLECPHCEYRRHRVKSELVINDVMLKCCNPKCGRTGIITAATWAKIEHLQ
jgi:hypothetical protein